MNRSMMLLVFTIFGVAALASSYSVRDEEAEATSEDICDTVKSLSDTVKSLSNKLDQLIQKVGTLERKIHSQFASCSEIKAVVQDSRSGFYDILVNGKKQNVYCNMDDFCGEKNGGWMRVGYLDMTKSNQNCPAGLKKYEQNGVRCCGRQSDNPTCSSVKMSTYGFRYTQVCGRVTGYQKGSPDGVATHSIGQRGNIEKAYMDGVSITRGSPRKHIWTYIASLSEAQRWCPCDQNRQFPPPSFVGEDYFCETGTVSRWDLTTLQTNDLLWDGKQCGPTQAACCSKSQRMPWFKKVLGAPSTDFLELRVCCDQVLSDEDVGVNYYEIYVK